MVLIYLDMCVAPLPLAVMCVMVDTVFVSLIPTARNEMMEKLMPRLISLSVKVASVIQKSCLMK